MSPPRRADQDTPVPPATGSLLSTVGLAVEDELDPVAVPSSSVATSRSTADPPCSGPFDELVEGRRSRPWSMACRSTSSRARVDAGEPAHRGGGRRQRHWRSGLPLHGSSAGLVAAAAGLSAADTAAALGRGLTLRTCTHPHVSGRGPRSGPSSHSSRGSKRSPTSRCGARTWPQRLSDRVSRVRASFA